jgi:VanZ family protein
MLLISKLAVTAWAIFILVASFLSPGKVPEVGLWNFDKLLHLSVYAILAFLLVNLIYAQCKPPVVRFKSYILAAALAAIYGIVIEISQPLLSQRVFDIFDIFANIAGCFIGVISFKILFKKIQNNRP